jgi:aryl-alcohol dehydrogenase-like predicted oxidoreductase
MIDSLNQIGRIGMGCMPLSLGPGRERGLGRETVHAALDAGVVLFDTADAYCAGPDDFGHNERLLAQALADRQEQVAIATKGGHTRPGGRWELDGSPSYLKAACEASLRRLGIEAIDLYQLHRPDPKIPFVESVGALRDLRDEGKIVRVGLSNVTVAQLEEAETVVEIAAVQNELSLSYTAPLHNGEVAACEQRGIPFLAWSPLGGIGKSDTAAGVEAVRAAADRRGASPQQVALAWLVSLADCIVPIPGASRPASIVDSAAAASLELEPHELRSIGEVALAV